MADRATTRWVGDSLHSLLGFSDKATAEYLVVAAKKAKSAQQLVANMTGDGILESNTSTKAFLQQLYTKAAGGASGARAPAPPARAAAQQRAAAAQQQRAAAVAAQQKAASYTLVDMGAGAAAEARPSKSKKDKRKRHTRKAVEAIAEVEVDDDVPFKRPRKADARMEDDEETLKARAREQDIQERDALAERIREKDKGKQRRILSKTAQAGFEEAKRRAEIVAKNKKDAMPKLREQSFQVYVEKRKRQQQDLLKSEIMDEEAMFAADELTEAEKADLNMKREILRQTEEFNDLDRVLDRDRYTIPEQYVNEKDGVRDKEKQQSVLNAKYVEDPDDQIKGQSWEQKMWEADQMKNAKYFMNKKETADDDRYDFIFEQDMAETFVMAETIMGTADDDKPQESEAERKARSMKEVRESLPVFSYRQRFLEAVKEHQVLIIVGETGSGKTTQLPQYLLEEGWTKGKKMIGCTQPRRVAAMSVAARVADETATKLGELIGFSIRFEDRTSERTELKYMTDGMLLREFLGEPDLASYSVMMIDEAHERTLHTDILFGLVKDIARFRPDLRLLISSATLDAEKFSEYFDDAPIFKIPGRRFDVRTLYTKAPEADYIDASVMTVLQIHISQPPGDVLVFLSGQEEIETCKEILEERCRRLGSRIAELLVLPIYANLPSDMQAKIFEPTPEGARKVVLATNIAETSLTIDGIKYVVDPGFCKQKAYNPRTGMESLVVTPTSQASANQRAGRAGRVSAGTCFRLFTQLAFTTEMANNTIPEIQRTNLGNVVLLLKSLGINDLIHFDFMDPPPAETIIRALEQLYALGALNDRGELTKLGRRMAEFPVEPQLSKMLIASEKYGVVEEILSITAMLSIGSALFYRPKDKKIEADNKRRNFFRDFGDHLTLLNVWNEWAETDFSTQWCFENYIQNRSLNRARDIRDQLVGLMERVEIDITTNASDDIALRKAVTSGFFYHTARMGKGGQYKTVKHSQTVQIHPNSSLFEKRPRWVIYHELVYTTKEYMRSIIEIDPKWLLEVAPHYYKPKEIEDQRKGMPKQRKA